MLLAFPKLYILRDICGSSDVVPESKTQRCYIYTLAGGNGVFAGAGISQERRVAGALTAPKLGS